MENTPITTAIDTPSQTSKLLLPVLLLVLGTVFWLWSISYRDMRMADQMKQVQVEASVINSDTDLNSEIDASLQSNSEMELKGVDQEF
jgi:uncharacterized membrane protein